MKRTALFFIAACEVFHAPPEPSLPQAQSGLLTDPAAPVVVAFDRAIDPKTLTLEIARDIVDDRGQLADEQDPPGELSILYSYDPLRGDYGGTSTLSADATTFTITPTDALPLNPALVLIVEPGLKDATYEVPTVARRKIVFSYQLNLSCNAPSTVMPAHASYFMLIDVQKPVGTQVKLFATIDVSDTGEFDAHFSSATRDPDPNRCTPACATTDACRTLPGPPACVAPSTTADSTDEYPDFVINSGANGFTFEAKGCVVDQTDGSALFVNAPVDVFVTQPSVTLRNTKLTATFAPDAQGVLRGAGALTADDVLLGTSESGPGAGTLTARVTP
ncbi:MAG TPA: hypothetical protein VGH28_26510 [Polyangiaceae bacterium]|jgi:hypothetical protein